MKYGRAGFKSLLPQGFQLNPAPSLGLCLNFWVLGQEAESPGLRRGQGGIVTVMGNGSLGFCSIYISNISVILKEKVLGCCIWGVFKGSSEWVRMRIPIPGICVHLGTPNGHCALSCDC